MEEKIRLELKKLENGSLDVIKLNGVTPRILINVIGDYKEDMAQDGDSYYYWMTCGKFYIFGNLFDGYAEITLKEDNVNNSKQEIKKEIKLSTNEPPSKIPNNLKLFYCTFGCGQKNEGYVQPVYAKNSADANLIMFELYGDQWCWAYPENEFKKDSMLFIYKEKSPVYSTK